MESAALAPTARTQAAAAITVSHVSKWFPSPDGPLHVLENVELTVPQNRIFAILGASGGGKSTLLNIISGIVKPDRGRVCL